MHEFLLLRAKQNSKEGLEPDQAQSFYHAGGNDNPNAAARQQEALLLEGALIDKQRNKNNS